MIATGLQSIFYDYLFAMTITGKSRVFGIVGNPVSHSLSPLIHNFVFRHFQIDAVYVPFLTHLEKTQKNYLKILLKNFNIQGLSITIPYKEYAFAVAEEKDTISELTKSTNTLLLKENRIYGYNTDGTGALNALIKFTQVSGKTILILGYGGSARAIAGAILENTQNTSIILTGRNAGKGKAAANVLNQKFPQKVRFFSFEKIKDNMPHFDILINTTPVGMKGYPQEKHEDFLFHAIEKNHVVMDIVYNPLETPLLMMAKKKKAVTVPGYWMFLYQAISQMELFTRRKIDENTVNKLKNLIIKNL